MSSVKLIGITQPDPSTGCETAAELVAYAARVSNPSNQHNKDTSAKLLKYLIEHKHWSPFEMVHITMEINTTRDIGRQILRHGSFKFQEFSQRYAEVDSFQFRETRLQDPKNRQNSLSFEEVPAEANFYQVDLTWWDVQEESLRVALEHYNWAIDNGIAKEQARAVLPEGLTCTTMYMAGSLRSWLHYCQLRCGPETQKEHREVANQCWKIVLEHFPYFEGFIP